MSETEQQISLSLKNIQFGDQNEYVHDLGCYLSLIGEKEEHFIDLILFSDESNKATLPIKQDSLLRLKLIFKRLSTNEQVGSISFSHHQISQISSQIQQFFQWFTLFDNQNDDEFDGILGESDDQESPRVQMQFSIGEISNSTKDLKFNSSDQIPIIIENIRETEEEHQENYHSLQLQKIKKQSSCEQNFQKRVESGLKRVEDAQKEFLFAESLVSEDKISSTQQTLYQSIKNISQNLFGQFAHQSSSQPQSANNLKDDTQDLNLSDENSNHFSSRNKLEPEQLILTSKEYQDKILQLQVISINQENELESLQQQYEKSITGYQKYFQDINDENLLLKNTLIEKEKYFGQQVQQLEENNKALEKQFRYMKTVLERRDKILETQGDEKVYLLSTVDQVKQILNHFKLDMPGNEEKVYSQNSNPKNQCMYFEQLERIATILEKLTSKDENIKLQISKLDEELRNSNELLSEAMKNKVENQKQITDLTNKLESAKKIQIIQENEIKDVRLQFKEQQHLLLQEQLKKLSIETQLKEQKENLKIQTQQHEEERNIRLKEIEVLQRQTSNKQIVASYKARLEEKDQIHEQLLKQIEKLQQLMKDSINNYESIQQNDIKQYTNELEVQIQQLNNLITEKDKKVNDLLYQNQDLCIQIASYTGQKQFIDSLINEIELQKNHFRQLEQYKDKQDNKIVLLQKELIKKNEQNLSLVQKLANMQNQLRQTLSTQEKIVRQAAMVDQQQYHLQDYQNAYNSECYKENNNFHQDFNEVDSILQQEYSSFKFTKLNQGLYQLANKLLEIQNSNSGIICRVIDKNNLTGNQQQQFILLDNLLNQERIYDSQKNYHSTTANSYQHNRNSSSSLSSKENGKIMSSFSSRDKEQMSSCNNTQRSQTSGITIKKSPLQISRISTQNLHKATLN